MTKTVLLEQLRAFTRAATKDLIMPTRMQAGDREQNFRAADVYLMRLPDSSAAQKKAPYVIHQIIVGSDSQRTGERCAASAQVRSIFCVYNDDEQEGGLMLLNLMETLRIELLKKVVIGNQFALDLEAGMESLVYPEDTAPYYAGEMVSTWHIPAVEREVIL